MLSLRPGRVIVGKYRLDQELARGGMGSLWIAFDRRLRRKVAVKFINSNAVALDEARVRFEREARAAAQIRSPHVVQTYDYGVDRGHPYIVMELLEGEDLGVRLLRERRLQVGAVSKILGQIARGLDAVHAAGIIHRDLKPANVFVALVAGEETMKLLDFGVARSDEKSRQRTTDRGALLGTAKYMAPEQALGEETIDHRADLWSLAVIAYRLLTGKYPFNGATLPDLVVSICTEPFAPPSTHVASLSPGVDAFFARALSRDVDQRFQSAHQMASSFAASLAPARNATLPWGTPAVRRPGQAAAGDPREGVAGADTARPEEGVEAQHPSRESQDETHVRPDALPPPRPILPSNYTPSPSSRRAASSRSRPRLGWWLSIPVAAVVVVSALVFGITAGRPPARITPSPPAESAHDASPAAATGR